MKLSRHSFHHHLLSAALAAVVVPLGHAQETSAITAISQRNLDLYASPDLNAQRRSIAVPEGELGSNWQVLDAQKQFYKIQAGEHGEGWARRSFITVARSSGIKPTCVRIASLPSEPTATTPGMGNRGC